LVESVCWCLLQQRTLAAATCCSSSMGCTVVAWMSCWCVWHGK
jgi:hypothetical protein